MYLPSGSQLDFKLTQMFIDGLDQQNYVQAEYIWIGGNKGDLRCKTKTLNFVPKSPEELPHWNYDGSSTNQAPGKDSEVTLVPRAIFRDPFRKGNNILVLCDTYDGEGNPLPTNTRAPAQAIFNKALEEEPWFGIEQEYTLFSVDGMYSFLCMCSTAH
jgi:glutamine synthetase